MKFINLNSLYFRTVLWSRPIQTFSRPPLKILFGQAFRIYSLSNDICCRKFYVWNFHINNSRLLLRRSLCLNRKSKPKDNDFHWSFLFGFQPSLNFFFVLRPRVEILKVYSSVLFTFPFHTCVRKYL